MRGDEARKHCPEVQLVQVPTAHGKADLTHYRSAGKQVRSTGQTEQVKKVQCTSFVRELQPAGEK